MKIEHIISGRKSEMQPMEQVKKVNQALLALGMRPWLDAAYDGEIIIQVRVPGAVATTREVARFRDADAAIVALRATVNAMMA